MSGTQKRIFAILAIIGVLYFTVFIFANNTGARDAMMISLFEPDEFAQYPVVMRMLEPGQPFKQAVYNFIAYRHYYYGSPFYFSSAAVLLPLALSDSLGGTQLNMLLLRQFISVLPMIAALLLLTWSFTRFESYAAAIGLFAFLLAVPAVVENALWWHVDSLAFLFVVVGLYFLQRDDLRFGGNFYLAAAAVGLATGTKVIGLFFVAAIALYLSLGLMRRQISLGRGLAAAAGFLLVMALAILISNPFLLLRSELERMVNLLSRQAQSMSEGWTLFYARGPASWLPVLREYYAGVTFLAVALVSLAVGILRSRRWLLYAMVAAWSIPFGLYVLFVIAIKPSHFFLPILLPVFGAIAIWPELLSASRPQRALSWLGVGMVLAVIAAQFGWNTWRDARLYTEALQREQNDGSLVFYDKLAAEYLPRLPDDAKLKVFRDVRMYFPEDSRWIVRTYWNSNYRSIENIRPDVIVLWEQRILDYTQAGARERAIDPQAFENTYDFYVDADNDELRGYRLVYRDSTGLFFVSEALYETYFR